MSEQLRVKIDDLHFELEQCKERRLREAGWTHTCHVPGSYWVWTKEHEGQTLMAGLSLALGMQDAIDYFDDLAEEEPTND